jgi:hypothetical protein
MIDHLLERSKHRIWMADQWLPTGRDSHDRGVYWKWAIDRDPTCALRAAAGGRGNDVGQVKDKGLVWLMGGEDA